MNKKLMSGMVLILLSGCSMMPTYERPAAPVPATSRSVPRAIMSARATLGGTRVALLRPDSDDRRRSR